MDLPVRSYSPLRAARRRHHITQRELAELAGVSQSFISNLELGLSALDQRVLEALDKLGEDTEALERQHNHYLAALARQMKGKPDGGRRSGNPFGDIGFRAMPVPTSSKPKKE